MNASGPTWWYDLGNLPTYYTNITSLNGFSTIFWDGDLSSQTCSLIFGTNEFQVYTNGVASPIGNFQFTASTWESGNNPGGLCLEPTVTFNQTIPAGTVMDQYFVILPCLQFTNEIYTNTYNMVTNIPAPRFFWPTTTVNGELSTIISNLQYNATNTSITGIRTNQLGPLIGRYNEE
jgi:hypothetical protein